MQAPVDDECVEQSVQRELALETTVLGENLPQYYSLHRNPHIGPGSNLG
jgi:hypothetical protein